MASNLRVDTILPSTGTTLGIGTASGTINFLGNSNINTTGVVTATSFSGSGANLTGLVSLANGANNRVITASSASALTGESTLTYDNGGLNIAGNSSRDGLKITNTGDHLGEICVTANRSSANSALMVLRGEWNNTEVASIYLSAGDDTSNKDNGQIKFYTSPDSGTGIQNRVTIDSAGLMGVGTDDPQKNLHVYAGGVSTLRIETGDSRGQAWDLLSTNGAGSNTGSLSIRNEAGSSYLDLAANGGSPKTTFRNGGANDLLVIDNNGNVSKPRNAFAIIHTNSGDAGVSNNKIKDAYAVFTGVHVNQGSHYNTSNGRFTCPVDGIYGVAFTSNLNMSNMSVGNNFNIQTRLNGSIQMYNYNTVFTTVWQQMTFTNYINCSAGDWLAIYYGGTQSFGADQGSGVWGELYFWLAQ